MEKKIAITTTISCIAIITISIVLANRFRKRRRKQKLSWCYLKSEAKPQSDFKRVLANNSYAPFKHLKLDGNK